MIAAGARLDCLGGALTEITGLVEKPKIEQPQRIALTSAIVGWLAGLPPGAPTA